nr:CsChR [synthetic construct]
MSRLVAASWLLALLLCGITSTTTASSAPAASSTDGTAAAAVSHYAMNGFDELAKGAVVPEDHFVCGPADKCYCSAWLHSHGSKEEKTAFTVMQWIVFAVCIISLLFYAYQTWRATCGWEEVYVTIIELVHVCFGLWHEVDSPCTLYLSTGNMVLWLRYAEWLLTCPVILIHLSNLTGMKNDYNKRTMALLVSDVGCIVWGTTAALSTDFVKIIFFFLGLLYGFYTFYAAAKIYIEAYHTVPKGICRQLVRLQAYDFFFTWSMFPILFMVGPEGFGKITAYSSGIAHEVCDLLSKNLWGLMGHFIRVKIHEHILVHGNITKKTKVNVAGDMVELDTYVDQDEEHDEG